MTYEETSKIELENTVRKLLEGAPVSSRQPVAKNDSRSDTCVQSPGSIEKTAHDMRASLNIIIGFSELMLDETMGKINKEQRRSLNDILNNGKRLFSLSDEIIKRLGTVSGNKK